jgi:hypothetical protein
MAGLLLTGALGALLFPMASASYAFSFVCLTLPVLLVGIGLLLWLPVGVAQGLVLRRVIPGFDRAALGSWVRTTALAGAGAMVVSAPVFGLYFLFALGMGESGYIGSAGGNCLAFVFPILIGAGIGSIFGFSQQAWLGGYVLTPDVWLKTSLVGWGLIMPLGLLLLAGILYSPASITIIPLMGMAPTLYLSNVLLGVLVITLPATVTGLALPRLMTPLTLRPPGPDLPRLFRE